MQNVVNFMGPTIKSRGLLVSSVGDGRIALTLPFPPRSVMSRGVIIRQRHWVKGYGRGRVISIERVQDRKDDCSSSRMPPFFRAP
jgi:hypothetical protein